MFWPVQTSARERLVALGYKRHNTLRGRQVGYVNVESYTPFIFVVCFVFGLTDCISLSVVVFT